MLWPARKRTKTTRRVTSGSRPDLYDGAGGVRLCQDVSHGLHGVAAQIETESKT